VLPHFIKQDPSACIVTFVSIATERSWSVFLPEGRIRYPLLKLIRK
jgi:hypothetical protein